MGELNDGGDDDSVLRPPVSIAVVGASRLEGGSYYGARLFDNIMNGKPKARVYPVNPRLKGERIHGRGVFATLSDLPEVPDMVVITSPVRTVVSILEEAERLGVRSAVIIGAEHGSAEVQRAFDSAIGEIAKRSGMRVIGPNSMGVFNAPSGLVASFSSGVHGMILPEGPVAVLAQSGAVISYLLQTFRGSPLGYSWLISTGNEAGASIEVLFDELVGDPSTRVIQLFLEGTSDGARLRRAAHRARLAGKAVVMMNAGISQAGREAVQSHTGRIAGSNEMFATLAREADIFRAYSYEELFDATRAVTDQGLPRAGRPHRRSAAVLTTSGGAGTVAADQLVAEGWALPPLTAETERQLADISAQAHVGNPADVTGAIADKTILPRMLRVLAECGAFDAVFVVSGAGGRLANGVAEELVAAASGLAPELYVVWYGLEAEVAAIYQGSPISVFPDSRRAVRAASASAVFRQGQIRRERSQAVLDVLATRGAKEPAGREGLWTAGETLRDLAATGVTCAPFKVTGALDPAQAAEAARNLGFPVALKIESGAINHKSDWGGVRLGLGDVAAVEAAVRDFQSIAEAAGGGSAGVLVQAMESGIEAFVGLKQYEGFGPLLVLGLGGTHAELHGDSSVSLLLPASRAALCDLVEHCEKLGQLLDGYRGKPPGSREALVDMLDAIAAWAMSKGETLREADFNPVMVGPDAAWVVDARAVFDRGQST